MKGKIIAKKKGGATYILYQYGSEYNQDKRYAVPQRTIVGKVSADDPTLMFPNEKFQVYFPDAEIPEELPFAYRSCCLKIGSCIIIQKVIDEYKLRPMLNKRFGSDTGLIRQGSGIPYREIMFRRQVRSGTFGLPDTVLPVVKLTFIDPVSLTPGTFTHTAGISFGQDLFPFSKTEVFCFL